MKKEIFVKDLLYPSSLGQGNEISCREVSGLCCGCTVIQDLITNKKLAEGYYYFDSNTTREIISSLSEEQKELCHASLLCGPIIQKMINGNYKYNDTDIYNNIRVSFSNGFYEPKEGKHRACMAKNFLPSTATIPVELE